MRSRNLAIGLTALGLSTALASAGAWAQEYHTGRGANDGGPLSAQQQHQQQQSQNESQPGATSRTAQDQAQPQQPRTSRRMARTTRRTRSAEEAQYLRAAPSGQPEAAPQRQYYGQQAEYYGQSRYNEQPGFSGEWGHSQQAQYYPQRPFGEAQYYNYNPGYNSGFLGFGAPAPAPADQSAIAACSARFRSFDPATGTYMGFDGMRHPCP